MKVFIQSIVAQLLLNPYICWRGCQALPPRKSWRVPFVSLIAAELSLYFVGFIFRNELPDPVMVAIQAICNTWYIASVYIALILLTLEILRFTNRLWQWFPSFVTRHWAQTKLALFFFTAASVTGLMIHAYHQVADPVVRHVSITIPKAAGDGRDSLTVVLMSDIHIGDVIGKEMVQKYVAMSNAQHPDLVAIAGDILDYDCRVAEREHIEEDFRRLEAPLGVYMINGNHEYRANRHAKQRWLKKTGATLLVDSVTMPDSAFYLIGRDDRINKKRAPLHKLTADLDPTLPWIVLDHQPWSLAETAMNGADLGLHGHTHNGQIWPYPLLMKVIYECPYGYYRKGPSQFYVSSGIGIAGPPYRVGTVSELVVLHIYFRPEKGGKH